ncbi:class I SAM-dependent methyltransferase [Devosia sp. ZB163]|uniref:class I SAM-dependent methyltransferase n=1 Tax=Devosia sp. ZB163 TaxID=3025938 RepID=UPI00308117A1
MLYSAHPGSGLRRLEEQGWSRAAPYWAYIWSGGAVLARHLAEHPDAVAGRTVLDLGCGGGIVAIAAARAGARKVYAADIDRFARAATELNAAANEVAVEILPDLDPLPPIDLILAGDVFYDAGAARRSTTQLDSFRAAGIEVLVGDPGRAHLPTDRLVELAAYDVPEFGAGPASTTPAAVYAYRP